MLPLRIFSQRPLTVESSTETSLRGDFDFKLNWVPGATTGFVPGVPNGTVPTANDPAPSVFKALEEIGLQLESGRESLDVLIVDSVQRPSEN
jgi:uncharacterized protein (TIGR03435 family)